MSFCKWCKKYRKGAMFAFEFVCDECVDTAFEYYAERDKEETWQL